MNRNSILISAFPILLVALGPLTEGILASAHGTLPVAWHDRAAAGHPTSAASARGGLVARPANAARGYDLQTFRDSLPDTLQFDQAGAGLGTSVASAGDVNGDGFADVIVGAPFYDNGQVDEGIALLFLGSAEGMEPVHAWSYESNQASAVLGQSVAGAGDVNGDGYHDVIVGADHFDGDQVDEGRVFVFLGSPTGLGTTPAWTRDGDQVGPDFGFAVTGAGDVNGDGYADVVVGARHYDADFTNEGRATLYLGSASGPSATPAWTMTGQQANAWFGASLGAAGDVNGDGYGDVIVGAPFHDAGHSDEGRAYVYLGSSAGLSGTPHWTTESNQTSAILGQGLAGAGDVNGDGFSDVIVGCDHYDGGFVDGGFAAIHLGSVTGLSPLASWFVQGPAAGSDFGFAVAGAGDLNGDGYADVLVGARHDDNAQTNEGRVYVYLGRSTGPYTTPSWILEKNQAEAWFGADVSGAGDIDGDGHGDVIIGAVQYDAGQTDEGAAFVYKGAGSWIPSGAVSAVSQEFDQDDDYALFGYSVAGAGDLNGDGYGDLVVGAPQYGPGTLGGGAAFIYLGGPTPSAPSRLTSSQASRFGYSVAAAGDVNRDGYGDLLVVAPDHTVAEAQEGAAFIFHGGPHGIPDGDETVAATVLRSDQPQAQMSLVAAAGDVNGDGYGDIVLGSPRHHLGEMNEGAAFVFHGSPAGIPSGTVATAAATFQTDQAQARISSIASAGDVNGDGFADIVIGSELHNQSRSDEGGVFVFHGGASGIPSGNPTTAATHLRSDQQAGKLGTCVAGAGDVNGDGYADLIAGAPGFHTPNIIPNGAFFVYLGGSGGIPSGTTDVAWYGRMELEPSGFGASVAGAGDLDGDGFADVAIGAPDFEGGYGGEGTVYLLRGGPSTLSDMAVLRSNQANAHLGLSVSGVGDFDGDGDSEVIAGSHLMDGAQTEEGRMFLIRSPDAASGRPVLAQQWRGDADGGLVQPWGSAVALDRFQVRIRATHPEARSRARVEVEACPHGTSFGSPDCARASSPAWTDVTSTGGGATLAATVAGLDPGTLYQWRARVLYAPFGVTRLGITAPPSPPHGPWRRLSGQVVPADLRTGPAPTAVENGPRRGALSIEHVRPNPTRGDLTILLSLPRSKPARLELFDIAGRRRLSHAVPGAPPGTREVAIDLRGLEAGAYMMHLTQEGEARSTRVLILP